MNLGIYLISKIDLRNFKEQEQTCPRDLNLSCASVQQQKVGGDPHPSWQKSKTEVSVAFQKVLIFSKTNKGIKLFTTMIVIGNRILHHM